MPLVEEASAGDHENQVLELSRAEVKAQSRSGVLAVTAQAPFQQVGFWFEGEAPTQIMARTPNGDWQPVEIVHSEAGIYVGRLRLAEPASHLELQGAQDLSLIRLEFFPEIPEPAKPAQIKSELKEVLPSFVVTRQSWRARAPVCNGSSHTPRYLTIHHTAGAASEVDPAAVMRSIQSYHIDVNGWCDIGYHFLVSHNGTIFQGRDTVLRQGAHVGGHNQDNVGISLMGNFETETVGSSQWNGLVRIASWLSNTYSIAKDRNHILGHQEWPVQSTLCPGQDLLERLGDLAAAI
jgi:hypothetical protein